MDISLEEPSPDHAGVIGTPPRVELDAPASADDDDIFSEKALSSYTPVSAALSNQSGNSVTSRTNNRPMVAKLTTGQMRNSPHPAAQKFNGPGGISLYINRLAFSETYRPGNVLVAGIDTRNGAARLKYDMTRKVATTDIVSREQLEAMRPVLREIAEELGLHFRYQVSQILSELSELSKFTLDM